MLNHELYMSRAIQLAELGVGSTRPNPNVGAVIVHNNKIIGEGYTSPFGGSHAEVNAINSVKDKSLLAEASIYVTLEPCSHYGKTPPCSDLLIKHNIKEVFIGCFDDNPMVAGKGIKKLKDHGAKVTLGVLETECKDQLKRFFTFHNKKRPYIILKWAESKDGFISPLHKEKKAPVWITNTYSRQLVHKWRTQEQAILVGTNTVTEDNPSLTVRDWNGENPTRVVLDRSLRLNTTNSVFNNAATTIIIHDSSYTPTNTAEHLIYETIDWNQPIAFQICEILHKNNINSIIIEGGSKTLQTFINENLWDEARIFKGNNTFTTGNKSPKIDGTQTKEETILDDQLIYLKNKTQNND